MLFLWYFQELASDKEKENAVPKALAYDHGQVYKPPTVLVKQDVDRSMKKRPESAKDPLQRVKSKRKVEQAFFYTGNKNDVGELLEFSVRKSVSFCKSVNAFFFSQCCFQFVIVICKEE